MRLLANVEVFCVGHDATVVGPGKVLGATESHHKHTIPRLLGNNVVWNGTGQDHFTRPPPERRDTNNMVCVCERVLYENIKGMNVCMNASEYISRRVCM